MRGRTFILMHACACVPHAYTHADVCICVCAYMGESAVRCRAVQCVCAVHSVYVMRMCMRACAMPSRADPCCASMPSRLCARVVCARASCTWGVLCAVCCVRACVCVCAGGQAGGRACGHACVSACMCRCEYTRVRMDLRASVNKGAPGRSCETSYYRRRTHNHT